MFGTYVRNKRYFEFAYSSVSYIDDLVGDVLNKLSNLGLAQDTVVMLMSDHGWHLSK